MTEAALALKEQVLALPFMDRLELYRALVESVSPPDPYAHLDDEEWIAELERRVADAESGRIRAEPYSEMIGELREQALRENQSG